MYNLLVQTVFILSFTFLKPTNYINTYYKEGEGSKIFLLLFLLLFATPLPVHCKEGEELWYLRFSTVFRTRNVRCLYRSSVIVPVTTNHTKTIETNLIIIFNWEHLEYWSGCCRYKHSTGSGPHLVMSLQALLRSSIIMERGMLSPLDASWCPGPPTSKSDWAAVGIDLQIRLGNAHHQTSKRNHQQFIWGIARCKELHGSLLRLSTTPENLYGCLLRPLHFPLGIPTTDGNGSRQRRVLINNHCHTSDTSQTMIR